jgi:SOS response regulatory protein OraA/RecX
MLKLPDDVLITEELLQTVRNMGLRRLTHSPMSRFQFEQYLIKRNVPLEVVTQVATRFEEIKLLKSNLYSIIENLAEKE